MQCLVSLWKETIVIEFGFLSAGFERFYSSDLEADMSN